MNPANEIPVPVRTASRNSWIDVLRGLAATGVVRFHPETGWPELINSRSHLAGSIAAPGPYAVRAAAAANPASYSSPV